MEVTLNQMLLAREERAARQVSLNRQYAKTIISFSMNIPGPVKDSPLIRRGFRAGCRELENRLPRSKVLHLEVKETITGCEAMFVVDMDSLAVKRLTTRIEDEHGLGRLFDMDVIDPELQKLDREVVGGQSRNCIVCGAAGRGCASRRVHSVAQLQAATHNILRMFFAGADAASIGALAVRSLMDEVSTTPKPGLVDRRNNGSHRDMNILTFRASADALAGYYRECVRTGMESAAGKPSETFRKLRIAGLQAEQVMYAATGGVNTHKGAIFTLGTLCGAAGRLWNPEGIWEVEKVCREVGEMTREAMDSDFRKGGNSAGYRLYAESGIRGIRGEAADGLPSVLQIGLPAYRAFRSSGMDKNETGVRTLLTLIANVEDTNMLSRGGAEGAKAGAEACAALLNTEFTLSDVEKLDDWFIQRNLSPGGCADLLAAVYFLQGLAGDD